MSTSTNLVEPFTPDPTLTDPLIAAVDGLVWSAIAHANGKVLRTPLCPRPWRAEFKSLPSHARHQAVRLTVDAIIQYKLLDGAWERLPEIAARYGLSTQCLSRSLTEYVAELLVRQDLHDPRNLPGVTLSCRR